MNDVMKELAKQIPSLVALIVLVIYGLKSAESAQKRFLETLQGIEGEYIETQKRSMDVIDRNTEAFGRVDSTLGRVNEVLDQLKEGN